MTDVFHEYPKAMYRGDGESCVVDDAAAEKAAAGEGWRTSVDPLDHDGDNRKGGSKPRRKAAE